MVSRRLGEHFKEPLFTDGITSMSKISNFPRKDILLRQQRP